MLLFSIYGTGLVYLDRKGPLETNKIVLIEKGASSWEIAQLLARENVIDRGWFFWTVSNITFKARDFQAGEYEFEKHITPKEVIRILSQGLIVVHKLVIPEGLTNKEVIALIEAQKALAGNVVDNYPEGYLMGNTYQYIYGDRRQVLLDKMYQEAISFLEKEWPKRDPSLMIDNQHDAMIIASIVEKEAIVPEERSIIAGVFYNRLRKGMKLQADPTIIYGITLGQNKFDRPITKADIQSKSPYNTYYINGLPPTPIANPSKGSVLAALHPSKHNYLYFVTNGNKGHYFSATLSEHNAHVANYRKRAKNAASN